jgi:hypothetical protein
MLDQRAAGRPSAAGDAAMTQMALLFVFAVERMMGRPT